MSLDDDLDDYEDDPDPAWEALQEREEFEHRYGNTQMEFRRRWRQMFEKDPTPKVTSQYTQLHLQLIAKEKDALNGEEGDEEPEPGGPDSFGVFG